MNRSSQSLSLSQCLDGFLKFKAVEGLSDRTLTLYEAQLSRFLERAGDLPITAVNAQVVEDFLYWLKTEYRPSHATYAQDRPVSAKTVHNYHICLKSFFSWAVRQEFIAKSPMAKIPKPRFTEKPVKPFTQEEVKALLDACRLTRRAETQGRRSFRMERPTRFRDEALILTLLDSGLRASELCSLNIGDVDQKTGEVTVRNGKGGKDRTVFIGKGTRRAIWRYLVNREDREDETAPLFVTGNGQPLNRDSLRLLINRLGRKANVKGAHPHRFRHTFATNYLRNGGDVMTLQALLGHSSLALIRRYAEIAQVDLERSHRKASPVDRWHL